MAPPPSPPFMKWLAVLGEKTSIDPFTLTLRSDWLYQPEDAILIGLDMTRNYLFIIYLFINIVIIISFSFRSYFTYTFCNTVSLYKL